jgi:glutaconyl-CoA/methylmalonyl-CoA decarboxylase subunit gamma
MNKKFTVKVNGSPYVVEVEELVSAPVKKAVAASASPGQDSTSFQPRVVHGSISAPMPGVVTKLCCSAGDQVKLGQIILVLEAMKMENEITATMEGIVQEIRVSAGQNVAPGEIVAVIA